MELPWLLRHLALSGDMRVNADIRTMSRRTLAPNGNWSKADALKGRSARVRERAARTE